MLGISLSSQLEKDLGKLVCLNIPFVVEINVIGLFLICVR